MNKKFNRRYILIKYIENRLLETEVSINVTSTALTYAIDPFYNNGGFCLVLNWGDGSGDKSTTSGTLMTHTYASAGSYDIKIRANCYRLLFGHNTTYNAMVVG